MKFIIWTIVWFGFEYFEKSRMIKNMGFDEYNKKYSEGIQVLAEITSFILYIMLYIVFII